MNEFDRVYIMVNNGDYDFDQNDAIVTKNHTISQYSPAEAELHLKLKSGLLWQLGFIEQNETIYADYRIYPDKSIECDLTGLN